MEAWKEELYHHGILGMKWGKRNGPPYPLGISDHSASERRAGWRKSLDSNSPKYRRKERDKSIQARYDSKIREIESGYKKGQALSEKDYERELAADNEARKAWKESKNKYKEDKVTSKYEKQVERYNKSADKIIEARNKNRNTIEAKFNKKIDKLKGKGADQNRISEVERQKKVSLSDFDAGTKYVKMGQNHYRSIIRTYEQAKVMALNTPEFKQSGTYKLAKKLYRRQQRLTANYGSSYPTLFYASRIAADDLNNKK